MIRFFMEGGIYMWPLFALALIIVITSAKKVYDLFITKSASPQKLESGIHAILFWGVLALLIGIFGHFRGIYLAMQAISRANDISPAIVTMGYAMSLITVLTGLFIFMVSALIWFSLRWRYKKLLASA
jgi:biopolymer transport protein ExbB/TolQ